LQRYKRPLFLGGSDTTDNLEISDLEVYWLLVGQLIREAKGLPSGTSVRVREVPLLALSGAASGTFKHACPSSDARL